MATGAEALKTFAVSRLLFDNVAARQGLLGDARPRRPPQLALNYGADDMDGSVVEYKITHDADNFGTPDKMTREDLLELIRDAGFTPGRAQHPLRDHPRVRRARVARRAPGRAAADVELTAVRPTQKLGWLYSVGRFGCFLAVATLLFLLGFRSWLLVLTSLLVSAPLSFVLLRKVRMSWGSHLEQTVTQRRAEKARLRAALRGDDVPAAE